MCAASFVDPQSGNLDEWCEKEAVLKGMNKYELHVPVLALKSPPIRVSLAFNLTNG